MSSSPVVLIMAAGLGTDDDHGIRAERLGLLHIAQYARHLVHHGNAGILEAPDVGLGIVARGFNKFHAFLDHGIEHLRPLVLRDVANDIGMHESTVSRVVNNKYMHTPQGVFEMKYFFHSGISSSYGDAVSSVTIKNRIKKIIEGEDPKKPLSDA